MLPSSKVTATGTAGATALVLVWVAGLFGIDVPAEVAAAFAVLLATAAGYVKTERRPAGRRAAGRHADA